MSWYIDAYEMYDLVENASSKKTKCNLKIADYNSKSGREEDRLDAIKRYEAEGVQATKNKLLQMGAREHFLRAGILHLLSDDSVTVDIAVDKYNDWDPSFWKPRGSPVCQLSIGAQKQRCRTFS